MNYCVLDTTIGPLTLVGDDHGLQLIGLPGGKGRVTPMDDWQHNDAAFVDAQEQLTDYFAGRRITFDLQLNPQGTVFQQTVWAALQEIPFGETRS